MRYTSISNGTDCELKDWGQIAAESWVFSLIPPPPPHPAYVSDHRSCENANPVGSTDSKVAERWSKPLRPSTVEALNERLFTVTPQHASVILRFTSFR